MPALTVTLAIQRLVSRQKSLGFERERLIATSARDLASVDVQLKAIDGVLGGLNDKVGAALVDTLLASLDSAGIRIEITG